MHQQHPRQRRRRQYRQQPLHQQQHRQTFYHPICRRHSSVHHQNRMRHQLYQPYRKHPRRFQNQPYRQKHPVVPPTRPNDYALPHYENMRQTTSRWRHPQAQPRHQLFHPYHRLWPTHLVRTGRHHYQNRCQKQPRPLHLSYQTHQQQT